MTKGIIISEHGNPEVMKWGAVKLPEVGPEDVLIKQSIVGLNFIDIYHRSGSYPLKLPSGIGMEAVGKVIDKGDLVKDINIGDRVGYVMGSPGSYVEQRVFPAERLIKIPENISDEVAAAMLLKGLTVSYLINRTYKVKSGETVLFHAIAGGVGLIACQWLKQIGVTVIGTVSNESKASLAEDYGCDHIINYKEEDFAKKVIEITNGKGLSIVYDGVGKSTFEKSLECLKTRGMMVSFGNASGALEPINVPKMLQPKGLFFVRPSMGQYLASKEELNEAAETLFKKISSEKIKIKIFKKYKLEDIKQAHTDLENRKIIGPAVLVP